MTEKPQVDFTEVVKASGMPVTDAELRAKFTAIATEEGLITNTSRMSPFWRLVTAIITAPVLWLVDVLVNTVLANMFVATASGKLLRLLAWAVNVTAKPASRAEGVIRFWKESAGAEVVVTAGTRVLTERINGVVYELVTTGDFTIESGVGSALVPVRATQAGAAYNLAPGYFRILPVAVSGITHVESEEDWLTVSMQIQDKDQSGQTSATTKAEQGVKGKELRISGEISFSNAALLKRIFELASAADASGVRQRYRVAHEVARAVSFREATFTGNVDAPQQEGKMAWLVTFTLTEHVSVQEKREARASGKTTATKQTGGATAGGGNAAGESEEKMTWFERRVLKPVNDALE